MSASWCWLSIWEKLSFQDDRGRPDALRRLENNDKLISIAINEPGVVWFGVAVGDEELMKRVRQNLGIWINGRLVS